MDKKVMQYVFISLIFDLTGAFFLSLGIDTQKSSFLGGTLMAVSGILFFLCSIILFVYLKPLKGEKKGASVGIIIWIIAFILSVFVVGRTLNNKINNSKDYSNSTYSAYNDHDGDGEYGFDDFLKDRDPELYDDIVDRYESLE